LITDYIVVGGGTAGCVVAARLTEIKQYNVLLIEAGPERRPAEVSTPSAWRQLLKGPADWSLQTLPEKFLGNRAYSYPQGKGLGGSTNLFAGVYSRGDRFDYDAWRNLGNPGWGWDYVQPYFEKPLIEGVPVSPAAWLHPFTRDFLKQNEANGAEAWQLIQRKGRKVTAADVYLGRVRKENRSNLTILTDSQVVRVILENGRARGVELLRNGALEVIKARTEVILCAGAIQTPAILLRSGIGPAAHLEGLGIRVEVDLPGVGENLQDHVRAGYEYSSARHPQLAREPGLVDQLKYFLTGNGPLSSPIVEAGASIKSNPDLPAPDLQLNFVPRREDGNGFTIFTTLLRPFSRGYLRLRSADPSESPDLHFHALEEPEDRRTLDFGLEINRQWGSPLGEPNAQLGYGFMWHPVGTTRMGVDSMAVVDASLKVHEVPASCR
jgi:choline dehydrogenase